MKKIMLISPKDYNFYNFRSELILKLKSMNFDIVLVCPYGAKIDFFTQRGCRFINLPIDRRGKNLFHDLKLVLDYNRIIRNESPDIVLTYTTKSSIYAGYVCRLRKIPCIINNAGLMQANGIFGHFMDLLYKIGFKAASCLMFQNEEEKEYIENLLKNKTPYRTIPGSGVNIDHFSYQEYPNDNQNIIFNYVGRIVRNKGIDELFACAKIIKKNFPEVVFRLYGDYDDDSYRIQVSELESKGIVEYCGVQNNMKQAIVSAHAVIHPSYYEGMTNVVLEHSAMGRVCIGSNIAGVREGIEDGVTGFLFEPGNVSSMVSAVERFISLKLEDKEKMGQLARKKMEKEFDREIVTNIYIDEIKKII